ncbi:MULTISPECIES: hypothetical protein [Deinococcus]|uniref:SPW repeat-containing protein n=1 Tax=Deinococcus rufus TaxID=2136097 RepID=A0ABV7ZC82_9DEIO|nr:hypothetical protein [Deinococcus sp. AB2017081]WQE94239.1 hypothetical protein U2P90_12560 [Deinococcus sp. AB2017081]
MTPEDWKKGMENEAASVEDAGWALETQVAAHRFWWRAAITAGAMFALIGAVQVLVVHVSWRNATPAGLWFGIMITVALVGAALGALRTGVLEVGVGALAYLPGAWLTVVALQAVLGDVAPRDPGFVDEAVTVLAVIAACAAGSMGHLTVRRTLFRR